MKIVAAPNNLKPKIPDICTDCSNELSAFEVGHNKDCDIPKNEWLCNYCEIEANPTE